MPTLNFQLLCCGDFQSTRNLTDLKCMAVPDKYKEMGTFYQVMIFW
jgi:lariat debranching enzyme